MDTQNHESGLTPVSKAERALARASTPEETREVEAMAAAAKAWAYEQNNYELAFEASVIYVTARCKTTELIMPTIRSQEMGRPNKYDDNVILIGDYGFSQKQWNRRKKELEARGKFGFYQDDCVVKRDLPTPYGLVGYYSRTTKEADDERDKEWRENVDLTREEIEGGKDMGAPEFMVALIGSYWTAAAEGDKEARDFLESSECREWCAEINKNYSIIKDWIASGYSIVPIHLMLYKTFENSGVEPAPRISTPKDVDEANARWYTYQEYRDIDEEWAKSKDNADLPEDDLDKWGKEEWSALMENR